MTGQAGTLNGRCAGMMVSEILKEKPTQLLMEKAVSKMREDPSERLRREPGEEIQDRMKAGGLL